MSGELKEIYGQTLDENSALRSDLATAVEIIENLNRLACAAMIDANRDGHEYDITAELAEARALLARLEVKNG